MKSPALAIEWLTVLTEVPATSDPYDIATWRHSKDILKYIADLEETIEVFESGDHPSEDW